MTSRQMTSQQMIERSISHHEIVTAPWSADVAEELALECEDRADASLTTVEY